MFYYQTNFFYSVFEEKKNMENFNNNFYVTIYWIRSITQCVQGKNVYREDRKQCS